MYLVVAFFFATILMLSSMTAQITYSTLSEDPGTYMTGQRIATSEEMGIDSLLAKYENNSLDPIVLVNDIYDRIDLNNVTDQNPILISTVPRADALERVDELKALRSSLPPGVNISEISALGNTIRRKRYRRRCRNGNYYWQCELGQVP